MRIERRAASVHCSTLGNSESEELRDTIEVIRYVDPKKSDKKLVQSVIIDSNAPKDINEINFSNDFGDNTAPLLQNRMSNSMC